MAAKHSHHVALTSAHAEYIAAQVAKGHYASASEVVRAGLRLLIEREVMSETQAPTRSAAEQTKVSA